MCTAGNPASPTTWPTTIPTPSRSRAVSSATSTACGIRGLRCVHRASRFIRAEDIYGIVPSNPRMQYDVREIIARIVDGSEFEEFKQLYGPTLVCGFAHICGFPVGILANNGVLFSRKRAQGRTFHRAREPAQHPAPVPAEHHRLHGRQEGEAQGIAKDGAKLVTAVATTNVPKYTVIIGGSYGAGNYGMAGRAYNPRFLWMWPNARISVMGGEQAASVLAIIRQEAVEAKGGKWTADDDDSVQGADPRAIREAGQRVLRHRTAVGRRRDRSRRYPGGARPGAAAGMNAPAPAPTRFGVFRM